MGKLNYYLTSGHKNCSTDLVSPEHTRQVQNFHRGMEDYAPTPLRELKNLAAELGIKGFFVLRKNKFRDRKTHVYRKCPHCKAQIRLPKVKGEHKCACPKCGE